MRTSRRQKTYNEARMRKREEREREEIGSPDISRKEAMISRLKGPHSLEVSLQLLTLQIYMEDYSRQGVKKYHFSLLRKLP